jgi:hypothetical protein
LGLEGGRRNPPAFDFMTSVELYFQPGDVEKATKAIAEIQATRKKEHSGLAELMGVVCAELGEYWDGRNLLNAFVGQMIRKKKVCSQLIQFARSRIAKGDLPDNPVNYNDMDDYLWAHEEDGIKVVEFPFNEKFDDPAERKPNGRRDAKFPWTQFTIYHESHGNAWAFLIRENYFTVEGVRHVYSTDFYLRRFPDVAKSIRKGPPKWFWENSPGYVYDKGFVLNYDEREDSTYCEADLWYHNLFGLLQHFDAIRDIESKSL